MLGLTGGFLLGSWGLLESPVEPLALVLRKSVTSFSVAMASRMLHCLTLKCDSSKSLILMATWSLVVVTKLTVELNAANFTRPSARNMQAPRSTKAFLLSSNGTR